MATYPLGWLADVLRDAGCRVIEEDGWKTRGRDGSFAPKAIMLHHDASPAGQTSNGVDVIRDGRPGLAGPLAQLWLAFDGTWHVVAAGRANHAGEGGPWGVVSTDDGNADCIAIETDHTTDEQWTGGQRSEGIKGVAALCRRLGITTEAEIGKSVLAHKEYAPDRKVDPDPLDMDTARANLLAYLNDPGEEAPVKRTQKHSTEVRELVSGQWRGLKLADDPDAAAGLWALAVGPADWFEAKAEIYLKGPPDTVVLLRMLRDDGDGTVLYQYPIRSFAIGAAGTAHVELACAGDLPDGQWLRLRGKTEAGAAEITYSGCRVAAW